MALSTTISMDSGQSRVTRLRSLYTLYYGLTTSFHIYWYSYWLSSNIVKHLAAYVISFSEEGPLLRNTQQFIGGPSHKRKYIW